MSRKRACNRKSTTTLLQPVVPCPGVEEYEIEYYRPGCYCTPQVTRHVTPYNCAYLHEVVPQWTAVCSTATYVVDAYGMVYYLSDFEHQLQLPNNVVETDITYHYCDKNEGETLNDAEGNEEEEAVSPRKRERLECDNDVDDVAEPVVNEETLRQLKEQVNALITPKLEINNETVVNPCTDEQTYYFRESNCADVCKVEDDVVKEEDEPICEQEK